MFVSQRRSYARFGIEMFAVFLSRVWYTDVSVNCEKTTSEILIFRSSEAIRGDLLSKAFADGAFMGVTHVDG